MLMELSKKIGLSVVIGLLISLFSTAFASPVIIKSNDASPLELGPHYQLFIDSEHSTTINDILSPSPDIKFSSLPNGKFNLGYRSETHWFKLNVVNNESHAIKQILEFNYPLLDELSVYIVRDSNKQLLAQYDTGDLIPFTDRDYQHPNFIFPVTLPAQTNLTFYFRIFSKGSMTADATLWQPDAFQEKSRLEYFYLALYLGLLIGLLSYNFLLYISLREVSYLYYVLFVSSLFFAMGSYSGLWFERLWPSSPYWHNISSPIAFSLVGTFAILFSKSFLQTRSTIPQLDKALSFIMIAFLIMIITSSVIPLSYSAPALSILAVILAVVIIALGAVLSLRGNRTAIIYLVSWLFFIFGALALTARNFGLIPNTIFSQYAIFIGSAIEILLLSFALAQRINQVQKHSQYLISANSELKDQESSLKQLAHYDALTGLSNRTLIMEKFSLLLANGKRNSTQVAILFLDLDGFKPINDRYGHNIGDDVLVIMADRLRSLLRNSDVIGRIGGDEFIVLVDEGDGDFNPQEVANKIKSIIAEPISIMGDNLHLGVSIGAASYPNNGKDLASLVSFADTAMYIDKAYRHNYSQN